MRRRRSACWMAGAIGLVAVILVPVRAPAEGPPDPAALGKYLGYTIQCGCVEGDPDWVAAIYQTLFTEEYGEGYVAGMMGFVRYGMAMEWDNQRSLCAKVCGMELTATLQEIVTGVGTVTSSEEFRSHVDVDAMTAPDAEVATPLPSYCAWKPMDRRCQMLEAQP